MSTKAGNNKSARSVKKEQARASENAPQETTVAVISDAKPTTLESKDEKAAKIKSNKTHIEGIIKTIVPAFFGCFAGIASYYWVPQEQSIAAWFVLMGAFYVQKAVYPMVGLNVKEFGGKDWFYIAFMTFNFFYVVWGILLN